MNTEKILGASFIVGSIIIMALYILWGVLAPFLGKADLTAWGNIWFIPVPPLYWLIFLPILLLILVGGAIFAWIGWALIQTPSPEEINIEEIEKQLEELEKEEETKEEVTAEETKEEEAKEETPKTSAEEAAGESEA